MRANISPAILIDYGCHSFTHRLAIRLRDDGYPFRYFVNGSLESPNLTSVAGWVREQPDLIRNITCRKGYGKMSLKQRLSGEIEWAGRCIAALEEEKPSVIIACCIPLAAVIRIQSWSRRHRVPFIYWLQDLQGRATLALLKRKFGAVGGAAGSLACAWEQRVLKRSDSVITIAPGHEKELPERVRKQGRYALLENWANVEEIPALGEWNAWSVRNSLQTTRNVVYAGTLGLKHDLEMFIKLAEAFKGEPDVRVVIVSGGQAADKLHARAVGQRLANVVILPFQRCEDVPQVLASASVLIAPLDPSAGSFCVPSKVLSYLCAGRPIVIAIDPANAAAQMIRDAGAGSVVAPGDTGAFIAATRALLGDPARCQALGSAAREFATRTFSLDRVVPRFLEILARTNINLTRRAMPEPSALLARSAAAQD